LECFQHSFLNHDGAHGLDGPTQPVKGLEPSGAQSSFL
jgi:hypothetical protein